MSEINTIYMQRALELAESVLGNTYPNPAVGAVIVRDNKIIGEGATQPPGHRHAEIVAMDTARESLDNAAMYVTLEPCCTTGRTPPCTEAIIRSGITSVVIACRDPNPAVNGNGIKALRAAGIRVHTGLLQDEAHALIEWFTKYTTTHIPYVTLKTAISLDGKITVNKEASQYLTGEKGLEWVHTMRKQIGAVAVGRKTFETDNPYLTVRRTHIKTQPYRIVFTTQCDLPTDAHIFSNNDNRVIIVTTQCSNHKQYANKAHIIITKKHNGRVDITDALQQLGKMGIPHIMLEGGSELIASFLKENAIDRVFLLITPVFIGKKDALPLIADEGISAMSSMPRLSRINTKIIGDDIMISGYINQY